MQHRDWLGNLGLALVLGVFAAAVKLLYSFLPLFNVLDVLAFTLIGGAGARINVRRSSIWIAATSGPAVGLCAFILMRLSPEEIVLGIGTGWLLSLFLIPASVYAGFALASRSRSAHPPA